MLPRVPLSPTRAANTDRNSYERSKGTQRVTRITDEFDPVSYIFCAMKEQDGQSHVFTIHKWPNWTSWLLGTRSTTGSSSSRSGTGVYLSGQVAALIDSDCGRDTWRWHNWIKGLEVGTGYRVVPNRPWPNRP